MKTVCIRVYNWLLVTVNLHQEKTQDTQYIPESLWENHKLTQVGLEPTTSYFLVQTS